MLLDFSASTLRVILRVYFTVAFALIAWLGDICCKYLNHHHLLKGSFQAVDVYDMYGWLGGFPLVKYIAFKRRLPHRFSIGLVMVLVATLSLVADILVSGRVKNVRVSARCPFGTGIVVSPSGPGLIYVPANGSPYGVTFNAQSTSLANGGNIGIYHKANRNINFRSQPQDIIASWQCINISSDVTYSPDESLQSIRDDLASRNYQYPNSLAAYTASNQTSMALTTHLTLWSSSNWNNPSTPFGIRASIDLSANETDQKVVRTFNCEVDSHVVDDLLSQLDVNYMLQYWLPNLAGYVYDGFGTPASPDTSTIIEKVLNSMVMVCGGFNTLLRHPHPGEDTTQGCLADMTDLPIDVISLVGICAFLVIGWLCLWIWLMVQRLYYDEANKNVPIPNDTDGWIIQAIYETQQFCGTGLTGQNVDSREYKLQLMPGEHYPYPRITRKLGDFESVDTFASAEVYS